MSTRLFVNADWRNVEGRLTAHFSKDETLQAELDAELCGGPKVHAINAGLIYGIAPEDAATHLVMFKGRLTPAYEAGKRLTHGFNYGMGAKHMADTYWLPLPFTTGVIGKLSEKYQDVVRYREACVDEVFGIYIYKCAVCGLESTVKAVCIQCSRPKRPVVLLYAHCVQAATRVLYTPFHRRRLFLGRKKDSADAVAAQLPQSCGAGMWDRTFLRLNGYDYLAPQTPWPAPGHAYTWHPWRKRLCALRDESRDTFVATGVYDNFLLETRDDLVDETVDWVVRTMETPWPELGGRSFPVEVSVGENWQKASKANPKGLSEISRS